MNIAARVESLAEAGGICISGTAYDQVERKLGLQYEYLGEQTVKNIDKPVRVYRVLSVPGAAAHRVVRGKRGGERKWRRTALVAGALVVVVLGAGAAWYLFLRSSSPPVGKADPKKMAFPLPDKPSIAVLPFVNMSEDPHEEYFGDGLTEDLITDLSKISGLFVIARNSTFTYKGKAVKIAQVAEELEVIGAKVRVLATIGGSSFWQLREISGGSGYGSQNDLRAHFGLGDATQVATLHVDWPSGAVQELQNVTANQPLTLHEPPAISATVRADGACELNIKAEPNKGWQIQASGDLLTWQTLTTVTNTSYQFQFTDPTAAGMNCRFYRLKAQ